MATSNTSIKTLLILGASGDLTGRLLLPGVARLIGAGRAKGLDVIGAGSDDWADKKWLQRVKEVFAEASKDATAAGKKSLDTVEKNSAYYQLDVTKEGELVGLLGKLKAPIAIYFALPPAVSQKSCEALNAKDLPTDTRLVMEKPFGSDPDSARDLNNTLLALVPEDHIHRVDHFLGKATVMNVLGLRFANNLLEPLWNNQHIEKVEIIFDEDLTLENRARYYDTAGALKDMLQSHLLQVMALVAMEPPASLTAEDVQSGKATALRAATVNPRSTKRARYTEGKIGRRKVPNYVDEPGVDPKNNTETLAQIEVQVDNWRWAGVPFILRSGKSLGRARKEIVITYQPVPHLPTGFKGTDTPTKLHIGLGPGSLTLELDVNGPGDEMRTLNRVNLEAELSSDPLLPYGEVLDGVVNSDSLLSVRGDTAVRCWEIVEPILQAWKSNEVPMDEYPAGSLGPKDWGTSE